MKILVTGGMGFIGSHIAEYHASRGDRVVVLDNLSRGRLLPRAHGCSDLNRDYLLNLHHISHVEADIRDRQAVMEAAAGCDVIFHAAGQTAVTTSMRDPAEDFSVNVTGTFNILEAARLCGVGTVVYCSTNKVYGANVNKLGIREEPTRYAFCDSHADGIGEEFPIDRCEHTPYGCSKLTGDLYCQEYARCYGLRTAVFRMSCIYGTRQFGMEDQGWIAWLAYATLRGLPITVYGDGKQVRDILYIADLVDAYDRFLHSDLEHGVFNLGGGKGFSVSVLELLDILQGITGKRSPLTFREWRHSDQKVYISDISGAASALGWHPRTSPAEGIATLVDYLARNGSSR